MSGPSLGRRSLPTASPLRPQITVRVSQINHCAFRVNAATLTRRSVTMGKIDILADWRDCPLFDEEERLAPDDAEAMTFNRGGDTLHARLAAHRKGDALAELTRLIAFQNLSPKFNAALDVLSRGFCRVPRSKGR